MIQKKLQTRVDILWIFPDFHRVLRVQSPSCTPHGNFSNGISPLTVKLSIKFPKICEPPPPSSASTILTPPTFRNPRVPKYFE